MTTRVLLLGATGKLGRAVAKILNSQGYWVRALIRDSSIRSEEMKRICNDVVIGDVTNKSSLTNIVDDIHIVISCLGVRSAAASQSSLQIDLAANLNIFDMCLNSKSTVKFIVFVSVLHGAVLRQTLPFVDSRERVVDHLHAQREIPFAVVRPSLFVEDLIDIYLAVEKNEVPLLGHASSLVNPISVIDVAAVVAHILRNQSYFSRKEVPIGGQDVFSWRALADTIADIAQRTSRSSRDASKLRNVMDAIVSPGLVCL